MLAAVESKINKNAKIIVACSAGGTMRPSQNLPEGQQSRSVNFSDSNVTVNILYLSTLPAMNFFFMQITDSSLPVSPKRLQECLPLRRGSLHMVQRGFASRVWRVKHHQYYKWCFQRNSSFVFVRDGNVLVSWLTLFCPTTDGRSIYWNWV
jgi:hypothetical protein